MKRFKRILVPVDGKRGSFECLRLACHIAIQNNSKVFLLHVVNESVIEKLSALSNGNKEILEQRAIEQGNHIFEDFIRRIRRETQKKIDFSTKLLKHKNVDEAIIDFGKKNQIDLIVISLTSKKHAADMVIGHITARVVEYSHIPVLTMPVSEEKYSWERK
ncbi:MAG: universal stress protein [Promethearchaeota archaeon]